MERHDDKVTKVRFLVCALGLVALVTSQMSRMVLNITITQMVEQDPKPHNENADKISVDGSCPWPKDEKVPDSEPATTLASQLHVNMTEPVDKQSVATTDSTIITTPAVYSYPRYKWTVKQQNVLLGGFFYSYFVFMILGGRMAEIYGAKYVLMLSVAGSAVINLATPWMADTSFALLVASRMTMGAIQAGIIPGMYALLAKWLTMSERSIFAPLVKMSMRLGMAFGSLVAGIVSGWPNVFYLMGCLSAAWSLVWLFVATSIPTTNRWVSEGEVAHINHKEQDEQEAVESQSIEQSTEQDVQNDSVELVSEPPKRNIPWMQIITDPSVIALTIVKLTSGFALDFLSIELPSYLKFVHHASKARISAITSNMFLIQVFLCVLVGWWAKIAIQRRLLGLGKTGVRKVFQGISSFGLSGTLFLLTFNGCNMTFVTILLLVTSFLCMFSCGGETMLPYDLSEDYPATIMAVTTSVAKISPAAMTIVTPIVLHGQSGSFDRWNIMIYILAGSNLVGALFFTFLVKAKLIKLTYGKVEDKKQVGPIETDLEASTT